MHPKHTHPSTRFSRSQTNQDLRRSERRPSTSQKSGTVALHRLRERLKGLKVIRSRVPTKHVVDFQILALRLGLGHMSLVGGFIDLFVNVILPFVGGLLVVIVGVVFLGRALGFFSIAACCDCCCSSSSGTLRSGGTLGVWGRTGGVRRGGGSASSRSLSLATSSRGSHADARTGSVVDKEARDAGSKGRGADGFPLCLGLEVGGRFGPVDLRSAKSVW